MARIGGEMYPGFGIRFRWFQRLGMSRTMVVVVGMESREGAGTGRESVALLVGLHLSILVYLSRPTLASSKKHRRREKHVKEKICFKC